MLCRLTKSFSRLRLFVFCLPFFSVLCSLLFGSSHVSAIGNAYQPQGILYWKNASNELQNGFSFANRTTATDAPQAQNSPTFTFDLTGATGVNNMCLGQLKQIGADYNNPPNAGNYTYFVVSFETNGLPNGFGDWVYDHVSSWTTFVSYIHDLNFTSMPSQNSTHVTVTGQVYGNNRTTICFSGLNLRPPTYGDSSTIYIGRPTVSFYESYEAMNNAYLQQIVNKLNNGIQVNATIDKSGLASDAKQQQMINQLQTNNAAITAQTTQQHSDAQAQLNATNAQTQQQKDQYDQEKQEESDREEFGKESADEAGGIFNFGVINPFAPIFELFKPAGCASIPIIAGFVGAESSQYCSWFPSSVRSVLTPAFGIVSMMLLFGFVMRWLGGSETIHFGGD